MISKEKFIYEFGGIINLLREHQFLAHSNKSEYQQKEKTAAIAFLSLIYNRTKVRLPGDYRIIQITSVRNASIDSARKIMRKAYLVYKKKSTTFPSESIEYRTYNHCAELWKQAISKL